MTRFIEGDRVVFCHFVYGNNQLREKHGVVVQTPTARATTAVVRWDNTKWCHRISMDLLEMEIPESTKAAALIGRRGGLKGGPARAQSLSPERRKEIASQAAKARWHQ